jgi:hypothetical protein
MWVCTQALDQTAKVCTKGLANNGGSRLTLKPYLSDALHKPTLMTTTISGRMRQLVNQDPEHFKGIVNHW